MRTLVTGAAGRVGRRIVERLLADGHAVTALDLLPLGIDHPALDKVTGALENPIVARQAVKGVDTVLHMGAVMSWLAADREKLFRTNVDGTQTLMGAAAEAGVKRVVFASSGEVYPQSAPRYLPIDEAHPLRPRGIFGLSKLLGEEIVRFYARTSGLLATVVRFSHAQDGSELLDPANSLSGPRFFLKAKIDQHIKLGRRDIVDVLRAHDDGHDKLVLSCNQDGRPYRMDICDTRDIVEGILLTLKHPLAAGQTFNLGSDQVIDFADVVPRMAELTGLPMVRVDLPGEDTYYETSSRAIRETLGFEPQWSFEMMLQEAAQVWRQRGASG